MKKLLFIILTFCIHNSSYAQIIDSTFGNNGIFEIDLDTINCPSIGLHKKKSGDYIVAFNYNTGSLNNSGAISIKKSGHIENDYGDGGICLLKSGLHETGVSSFYINENLYIGGVHAANLKFDSFINNIDSTGHQNKDFGNEGKIVFSKEGDSFIQGLYGDDDNIFSVGSHLLNKSKAKGLMTKHSTKGAIDLEFGDDGHLVVDEPGDVISFYKIGIAEDDKILVAGIFASSSNNYTEIVIYKVDKNSNIDTTFGNNGKFILPFKAFTITINQIFIDNNSDIFVVGTSPLLPGNSDKAFVSKIKKNGTIDSDFGTNGTFLYPSIEYNLLSRGSRLLPNMNGGFMLVGSINGTGKFQPTLISLNQNGTINKSFGQNGIYTFEEEFESEFKDGIINFDEGKGTFLINDNRNIKLIQLNLSETSQTKDLDIEYISFYPTLFKDILNIKETTNNQDLVGSNIILYNHCGELIYNQRFSSNTIDLGFLISGVYFIQMVKDGNKTKSSKIIKL